MSQVKLTKGELKKQRDSLKQFQHYLPTLLLKKQQLQMKILEARLRIEDCRRAIEKKKDDSRLWLGLFGDPALGYEKASFDFLHEIKPVDIFTDQVNVAGASIPVFKSVAFREAEYDLYAVPLWVDRALEEVKAMVSLLAEIHVIEKQIEVLQHELRITTQRVNLFEKIKIPECKNNIRRIRIYLGDQQANAVGISKVAKRKIEDRDLVAAAGV